jgi:ATP-dependent DNA helicase RecG
MRFETPLVKVVGDRSAAVLDDKLGLRTVGDLLHHYPRKYFVRGALTPLNELEVGEHVTVLAQVRSSEVRPSRNGKLLGKVVVTDGTGTLDLTFFGRAAKWQCERLKPGAEHLFAGTVSVFNGRRQLTHPEVFLSTDQDALAKAGTILPIYPAASGVDTLAIAKAVDIALSGADLDDDPLPESLRKQHGLVGLRQALEAVHGPQRLEDVTPARERLMWDESFVLQVVLARRRAEVAREGGTPRPGSPSGLLDAFDANLPFTLTQGQVEVGEVLAEELARAHPMHRLLQGEVGSGKTVVALRAMLRVIDSGGQAALLAPTEVLAQQHARSLRELLGPLATAGELGSPDVATRVALLTGSLGAAARRRALEEVASGEAGIVIGTHALLYEGVEFHDLGLVVVDEQHRFGVEQRDALRAKGTFPHVLVMTATPIPRTVAMTVYGDLEVSTLRELPAGRSPLTTRVVGEQSDLFPRVWDLVRREAAEGRQAFVVCPRIGDEEVAAAETRTPLAVLEVVERLAQGPLAGLRVDALHGRMPPEVKEEQMRRFAERDLDVLVSTTVIEVGVDVPNATVMVVLDAERFGISQLHQLRGRVGRGAHPGTCVLVTALPRDAVPTQRLFAVASTQDGFELSRLDLEVRREGDVLGEDQSGGRSSLRFLRLDDLEVIQESRAAAIELVEEDPDLTGHPALRAAVDAILDEQRQSFIEKA